MGLNRRDFIKYSMLAAAAATTPATTGCAARGQNVPALDYSGQVLLTRCNVIDVKNGMVTENATITIDAGKIVSVSREARGKSPGAVVIDLVNKYVIPGLIDGHCHSTVSPVFAMSFFDLLKHAKQQKRNYALSIESGITTIRDMGAFPGMLRWFIRDIERGSIIGPRVVYCNSMLNVKGGHPEVPPSDVNAFAVPASWFVGMVMNNVRDTKELKECLDENAKGASFIKLTMDNKTIFCKKNDDIAVYSDEQLDLVFQYAEKTGLSVAGHHHYKFGFDRALKYPINSLEHIVSDANLSDDDVMDMERKKVAIVPTMAVGQSFMIEEAYEVIPSMFRNDFLDHERKVRKDYFEGDAFNHCHPSLHKDNLDMLKYYKVFGKENLWEKKKFLVNPDLYFGMMKYGSENLKKMKAAGVLIGCGIDAGMPLCYFGGMYREYEIYSRLGFSNLEILQCATINNAKILQREESIGSLEPGKLADMVVCDANPLDDIRVLRKPSQVFKEGRLMHSKTDLMKDGSIPV